MATLNDLVTPAEYAAGSALFPTEGAVMWAIRVHRPRLVETGAVVRVRGRTRVNKPRFERVMAEILISEGQRPKTLS